MTAELHTIDTRSEVQKAFFNYNIVAENVGGSKAKMLTPAREKSLRQLLRAVGGLQAWNEALANVEKSTFLRGEVEPRERSSRAFRLSFDFMVRESSFMKVWEGVYSD